MKIAIIIVFIISIALPIRFYLLGQKSQEMSMELGIGPDGGLKPCDKKSHCVETGDIEIPSSLMKESALDTIKSLAPKLELELIKEGPNYLHFIHQSAIFGFTDDIEFFQSPSGLQFRSGSRVGHSDMGVNEKRIKALFQKADTR